MLNQNIAVYGEATQSSTYQHYGKKLEANFAIDGVFDTEIDSNARCALTQWEQNPWWQVDLKAEYEIYKVALTTRNVGK